MNNSSLRDEVPFRLSFPSLIDFWRILVLIIKREMQRASAIALINAYTSLPSRNEVLMGSVE